MFGVTSCVQKFFGVPSMLETKKIAEKYLSFEITAILSKTVFVVAAKVFLKPNSGHIFNTTGKFCMENGIPWK
jgi:hypothetical protein